MKKQLIGIAFALFFTSAFAKPTSPMEGFKATVVEPNRINEIWQSMRVDGIEKDNYSSNSAMIWAYDMKENFNIDSKKIFIHYTSLYSYIREIGLKKKLYKFKIMNFGVGSSNNNNDPDFWLYHTAPVIKAGIEDIVMDRYWSDSPMTAGEWEETHTRTLSKLLNNRDDRSRIILELTNNIKKRKNKKQSKQALKLINSSLTENGIYDVSCKGIIHISEHDLDKKSWCHTQYSSMYYWNPTSLRFLNHQSSKIINHKSNNDKNHKLGREKFQYTYFDDYALEKAEKQAFSED